MWGGRVVGARPPVEVRVRVRVRVSVRVRVRVRVRVHELGRCRWT